MNVLITGINGFLGKKIAKELLEHNHTVTGLDVQSSCAIKGVQKYFSGSVLDKDIIACASQDVSSIIHLAALTSHEDIVENKFNALEINILGTKNILDEFIQSKSANIFIFSSTGKVYGDIRNLPISEEHDTNPLNILGKSKLITELLIDFYSTNDKTFLIFRIFNIYGPGQKHTFLIPTILRQIKECIENQDDIEIALGDINAKRDYIYIDDIISAFSLAVENFTDKGLHIFNLATGKISNACDIIAIISNFINKRIQVRVDEALIRHDERSVEYGSYAKALKSINWKPQISLTEGLARTIEEYL